MTSALRSRIPIADLRDDDDDDDDDDDGAVLRDRRRLLPRLTVRRLRWFPSNMVEVDSTVVNQWSSATDKGVPTRQAPKQE